MFRALLLAASILLGLVTLKAQSRAFDDNRPLNLVFILTDNQGAWTLGCYGNPDIRTPNIDRLAREGVRFTRAFASNPVCSPTRATYLTGLIPSQHGVHSYLGGERPNAQTGPDAYCTIREFASLPKIMSQAGYVCGLSGKWHLGANLTPQEGFTDWITMPAGPTEFMTCP
jgi:arylsulfatase A-like enzyme